MSTSKVAFITGSSRGIGFATATELAKAGYQVILNGRNTERLKKAVAILQEAGHTAAGLAGDLSDPQVAQSLLDKIQQTYSRLDVVVNNAGLSMRGRFDELQPEVFSEILKANVTNAMNVSRFSLPLLQESKGSLVFVSSVVGLRGLPMTSVYSAAKMALTGLAEAIKLENRAYGVHVGIVYVGFTQNAADKTTMSSGGEMVLIKPREGGVADTPENVGKLIMKNIRKRKFKTVHSVPGKLNAFTSRFFPGILEAGLNYIYLKKPEYFE